MLIRGARVLGSVLVSLTLLSACGASSGVTANCQGVGPEKKWQAEMLLRDNGNPLFLGVRCTSRDQVQILDSQGKTYDGFDDFLEHNHLLTKNERISVPRRIPSFQKNVGYVDLPGHTTDPSPIIWSLIGGVVVIAALGVTIWRSAPRQARSQPDD